MKKSLFIACVGIAIIVAMVAYWRYSINKGDAALMKEGNRLVEKIESYKKRNHELPASLEDLKLNLPDNYPLNYSKWNDTTYVVGFQIGFFKDMVYHSSTKKWGGD